MTVRYKCPNCDAIVEVSWLRYLLLGRTRPSHGYIKCPKCQKYSWMPRQEK